MDEDRYSPSLKGDIPSWKELIDLGRDVSPEEVIDAWKRMKNGSKEEFDLQEDGTSYIIRSESERVKTLDQLLEEMEVDTEQYEIYRTIHNKYDQHSVEKGLVELFQVKAWAKKKYLDKPDMSYYEDWFDELGELFPITTYSSNTDGKPVVCAIADLHIGGFSEEQVLVPDFNSDVVRDRLDVVASRLNALDSPVHLKILGDFIESFTGKNHGDTWKQIEAHGMEVSLMAFDIIREFILKLHNLVDIEIIGGNHDRISKNYGEDKEGQVAYLIAGLLQRFFNGLHVEFNPLLLSSVHDNICYIITHGDKNITKKKPTDIILEYGKQDMYNVLLSAHKHEEEVKGVTTKFRSHRIPPICGPNEYSIQIGYRGNPGFVIVDANDFGSVDVKSIGL